ncbi:MAG: serine hydrolase, partial [Bacteroidales bacterium]|nr:serine hydrolase [Candidatus Colimorpha onthohippi]
VVDVNSNPDNPVIGRRSFSASPSKVAALGVAYTKGLQSQGVMAVAKHFPGHGDTQSDSHQELPLVSASCDHLDSIELYPFVSLIKAGVKGIMTAHLSVPSLDTTPCLPSSLSEVVVNELLRLELGFHGLAFTDGIDMRAVTNHYSSGQAAVMAIRAGNDVILIPSDIPLVIDAIVREASADPFFEQLVKIRCRRVLRSKYELMKSGLPIDELSVPDVSDSLRCVAIVEGMKAAHDCRIDSILLSGIKQKAYPGCQLLVLKHGVPVVRRCYGSFVYEDTSSCVVKPSSMYDLASLTKVTATTLAIMKLVDMGRVKLDGKLSDYLPYLEGTNKSEITLREVLSHIARLKPFDSYWQQSETPEDVLLLIADSPLEPNRKYLYSDLGFILLGDMVRYVSGLPLDRFMQTYFYSPMELNNISFCPTYHGFDFDQIVPTEEDSVYRMTLIHGQVHDPNAYALGGVAGHAGVFASADDVAALMQMLLDGGVYKGRRYLSDTVISQFNTRYYSTLGNRRALGFDKPLLHGPSPHVSHAASQASFGHTGFTGTMLWVDPEHDMVYVFLSNRVYPSAKYNKLSKLDIRTNIQDVLYEYF